MVCAVLSILVSSCDKDSDGPQSVNDLKGYQLIAPDTLVFMELNQTIRVDFKVLDGKGQEVPNSRLSLPGSDGNYTIEGDSLKINYPIYESGKYNQILRFYSYCNEGTVWKDIYVAFRPDLSKSTPTHPHIFVEKPGTLESYIDPNMEREITGMTIYGLLNTVDQVYLRKLLGAPEAHKAWLEECGLPEEYEGGIKSVLPRDENFFAKIESKYKLEFLNLKNVVYKSIDDPENVFFFLDYKVTDEHVKPLNMVRYLFECCVNLKEIYLPYWYEGLNSGIFNECGRLETIHYPDHMVEYGCEDNTARNFHDLIWCTNIRCFDLGKNTTAYRIDENGNLWETETNRLMCFLPTSQIEEYHLPTDASFYPGCIFHCPKLKNVYVHTTYPMLYGGSPYIVDLFLGLDIIELIRVHIPKGYKENFKNRIDNPELPYVNIIDDVTDYVEITKSSDILFRSEDRSEKYNSKLIRFVRSSETF